MRQKHRPTTTSGALLDCENLFLCFFAFLLFAGKERERASFSLSIALFDKVHKWLKI
jgi:hypothetical protein